MKPAPGVDAGVRGAAAEDLALRHLQAQGLQLLARNWRCPGGELDLVMREGATLVMVEVRQRAGSAYGGAFESVDARKRARLVRAARLFLAAHPRHADSPVRFDVVALQGDGPPQWLSAAFETED
jgi:putative endonuclease